MQGHAQQKQHVHPDAIFRTTTAEQLEFLSNIGVNLFATNLVNDAIFFVYFWRTIEEWYYS